MSILDRQTLKSFFATNAIPTQGNFSDLIDSFINQADDGINVSALDHVNIGNPSIAANLSLRSTPVELSGTITIAANDTFANGTDTKFISELHGINSFQLNGTTYQIDGILSDSILKLKSINPTLAGPARGSVEIDVLSVEDESGNTLFYITKDGKVGVGTIPSETFEVNGNAKALGFIGDGSELTNLAADQIKGKISPDNLPGMNISEVDGLLTILETYENAISGTVSGSIGSKNLAGTGTDFQHDLQQVSNIKIGDQIYDIDGFRDTILSLKTPLTETITNEQAFVPSDFLHLNDVSGTTVLNVSFGGHLETEGIITATQFIGDGSELTNIQATQLQGQVPAESLPPINISRVNGLLTIVEAYDKAISGTLSGTAGSPVLTGTATAFAIDLLNVSNIKIGDQIYEIDHFADQTLTLKTALSVNVNAVQAFVQGDFINLNDATNINKLSINKNGDLQTSGIVHAAYFSGNGTAITSLLASQIQGVISRENLPSFAISEVDGLLKIVEIYDKPVSGTVSGTLGSNQVTGSGTSFQTDLLNIPAIQIKGQVYQIDSVLNQVITLKTTLPETVSGETIYLPGDFLSLVDVSNEVKLSINKNGDLQTSGMVQASSFKGDGSALTNLPQVNVSEINGFLSIVQAYSFALPGTVSGTSGSTLITGNGTQFSQFLDSTINTIRIKDQTYPVASVQSNTALTLGSALTEDISGEKSYIFPGFLALSKSDGTTVFFINPDGDLRTDGQITANGFSGSAANLTHLQAAQIEGVISKDNLPDFSNSVIEGKLTINETYEQPTPGNVSGTLGSVTLSGNATSFTNTVMKDQSIKIGDQVYVIQSIEDNTSLTLKSALTENHTNETLFVGGDFMSLTDIKGTQLMYVNLIGSIYTTGTVNASGLSGDGSAITNLNANQLNGIISSDNLPPVSVSQVSGTLTINEAYDFQLPGTVSGTNGSRVLTSADTDYRSLIANGQYIMVDQDIYQVEYAQEGGIINLAELLRKDYTNASINIPGPYLNLNDIHNRNILSVDARGNLNMNGIVQATQLKGDGSELTNLNAANLQGIISADHLPSTTVSSISGQLTINEAYDREISGLAGGSGGSPTVLGSNTFFSSTLIATQTIQIKGQLYEVLQVESDTIITLTSNLAEDISNEKVYVAGDFLALTNLQGTSVTTVGKTGDFHTQGQVYASAFSGDGSQLINIQASQLVGNVSPANLFQYIKLLADKMILINEDIVTLSWSTFDVESLTLEYVYDGAITSFSTQNGTIALEQASFPVNGLYQNTAITLTAFVSGVAVFQEQRVITVVQNANQYVRQLKSELYGLSTVLVMCGTRFGLNVKNDQNLTTLATAVKLAGFDQESALTSIPAYYQSIGQSWDDNHDGVLLYDIFDVALQVQINRDVQLWAPGKALPDLLSQIHAKYDLGTLTEENLEYLSLGVKSANSYSLSDCFQFIPQFYRDLGQTWYPETNGIQLQNIFSLAN